MHLNLTNVNDSRFTYTQRRFVTCMKSISYNNTNNTTNRPRDTTQQRHLHLYLNFGAVFRPTNKQCQHNQAKNSVGRSSHIQVVVGRLSWVKRPVFNVIICT